jgi:hypothetical protein
MAVTQTNYHLLVVILVMSVFSVAGTQTRALGQSKITGKPEHIKLKRVELDGKYSIDVPAYLSANRLSDAAVPFYAFESQLPHSTTIRVEVLPYAGEIPMNKDTGKLVAPATGDLTCEVESLPDPLALRADGGTPPLTRYFTIADNRDVYYGCTVIDNAYECSMNSPCPLPVRRESRYTTQYAFAVFDKETRLIVEFTGSHDGPSKKVTGFKGDGRLLRDTIVPSLTRIK